jgi:hypothetical protein
MPMGQRQSLNRRIQSSARKEQLDNRRRKKMDSERLPLFRKTTIEQGKRKEETSLR